MANLTAAFQSLPESIRQWLSDEHVAAIIDDINQRLNLTEENGREEVIPHLILRLCVQDLNPRQFVNELSHWLDIGFDSAKILSKELEEKILQPIAEPLKTDVGVDLKLLSFAVPEPSRPAPSSPPPSPPELPVSVNAAVTAAIPAAVSTELPAAPPFSQSLPPEKLAGPPPAEPPRPLSQPLTSDSAFNHDAGPVIAAPPHILHEEKNPVSFNSGINSAGPTPQSSFHYKMPMGLTPDKPPEPVHATIESPPLPTGVSTPTTATNASLRVIHYSAFTTRLIPIQESPSAKPVRPISVPKSRWFIS